MPNATNFCDGQWLELEAAPKKQVGIDLF